HAREIGRHLASVHVIDAALVILEHVGSTGVGTDDVKASRAFGDGGFLCHGSMARAGPKCMTIASAPSLSPDRPAPTTRKGPARVAKSRLILIGKPPTLRVHG